MGGKSREARLEWIVKPLDMDPFDLVLGMEIEHRVHYAQSSARTEASLRVVVASVVERAFSLASRPLRAGTTTVLFHFETTDGGLRATYCDSTFQHDSIDVVHCHLLAVEKSLNDLFAPHLENDSLDETDWRAAMAYETSRIERLLVEVLVSIDLTCVPPELLVAFSGMHRSEVPGEFAAKILCLNKRTFLPG